MMLDSGGTRLTSNPVEIYATDLSSEAIARARSGVYTDFEVGRGMSSDFLQRYFQQNGEQLFTVVPSLRRRVRFDVRNLMEPFGDLGRIDIVFCRNVLIYFDRQTKSDVLNRLAKAMPADGFLVLGGAETTLGLCEGFKAHRSWRNVYMRPNAYDAVPLATTKQSA